MIGVVDYEPRTFEQRFGTRCPFCNEPWSSQKRCDPNAPDYTIQDSLRLLFAGRVEKNCGRCGAEYMGQPNQVVCSECRPLAERARNTENVRLYRERHAVPRSCEICGGAYATIKTSQTVCSRSCGMVRRRREEARRGQEEQAA